MAQRTVQFRFCASAVTPAADTRHVIRLMTKVGGKDVDGVAVGTDPSATDGKTI